MPRNHLPPDDDETASRVALHMIELSRAFATARGGALVPILLMVDASNPELVNVVSELCDDFLERALLAAVRAARKPDADST